MAARNTGAVVRAETARVVDAVVTRGRSLDAALAAAPEFANATDKALLRYLSYGALRNHWQLSEWLDSLLQRPLRKRDSLIGALLRVGLYQLTDFPGAGSRGGLNDGRGRSPAATAQICVIDQCGAQELSAWRSEVSAAGIRRSALPSPAVANRRHSRGLAGRLAGYPARKQRPRTNVASCKSESRCDGGLSAAPESGPWTPITA